MGLTRSNWTTKTIERAGKKFLVAHCTVAATSSEKQAFTKAITFLNPARPFKVTANVAGTTLDGTSLPVDMLGSPYLQSDGETAHGSVASMDCVEKSSATIVTRTGASSTTVVGGIIAASLASSVKNVVKTFEYKPDSTAAHITLPTMWLNLDGAGSLSSATCIWMITQEILEQNRTYR